MLDGYYYRIVKIGNKEELVIDFYEDKYLTLVYFLNSDVRPFEDRVKKYFDKVISGESEYEEINGNICGAEISPITTKLYNNLENGAEYDASCCEVDTKELRKLIEIWCKKVRKFDKRHRN